MSAAARDPASPRDPLDGRDQQRAFCARMRDFGYNYAEHTPNKKPKIALRTDF